jgi:hypothetical protein
MRRIAVLLLAISAWSIPVFAQEATVRLNTPANVTFASNDSRTQAAQSRGGFTVLVNMGLGIQNDSDFRETAMGLAGANVGVGGFVTPRLAILGRFSITTASYDFFDQVAGVGGATVQYWVSDRFTVEAGGGTALRSDTFSGDFGFGLIFGASAVVWNRGGHNLVVGAEYAPAFTSASTVQNIGITFGYQFHLLR